MRMRPVQPLTAKTSPPADCRETSEAGSPDPPVVVVPWPSLSPVDSEPDPPVAVRQREPSATTTNAAPHGKAAATAALSSPPRAIRQPEGRGRKPCWHPAVPPSEGLDPSSVA